MKLSLKHNVKTLLLSTTLLAGIDTNAMASEVTFDSTTPSGTQVYYGNNTYTENGLNITGSSLFFNPFNVGYGGNIVSFLGFLGDYNNPNGTSFAQIDGAGLTLSASAPFSLKSLQAGTAYSYYWGANNDSITLTGYVNGNATPTFSDTLNIAAGTEWSNISLTGWNNLSSVVISGTSNSYSMFVDSIVFTQPSAVPVPSAVWLFGSAIAGFVGFNRRKPMYQAV